MKGVSTVIIRLYFAIIAAVTFFILMYGAIDLLDMGLKTYIFKSADVPAWIENCTETKSMRYIYEDDSITPEQIIAECEISNQNSIDNYHRTKANNAVHDLSILIILLPLFLLHFRIVYQDWKKLTKK